MRVLGTSQCTTLDDRSRCRPAVVCRSKLAVIRQILWRQAFQRFVHLNSQLDFNALLGMARGVQIATVHATVQCGAKKLHHYFCSNFVKTFYSEMIIGTYSNKFGTKRHQNHQSLLKHIFTLLCETQHAGTCS